MSRNGRPQRNQARFVNVEYVRCPDCEDRGALRNDGGAVIVSGGQLRGATKDVGLTTASAGCPTCRGRGAILTSDVQALLAAGVKHAALAHLDPYALEVRAAIERREQQRKRRRAIAGSRRCSSVGIGPD